MSDSTGRPLDVLEIFRLWDSDDTAGYDSLISIAHAMAEKLEQAEAEVERVKNELERQGQQDTHISTLMRENAAERIENTRLREAFVTMEKAYNANEAAIAALREQLDAKGAILRQLAKEGRAWIDRIILLNDRVELVYASESEVAALRQRHEAACAVLDGAGVECEDPRISYTTIQVDRAAWEAWVARGRQT